MPGDDKKMFREKLQFLSEQVVEARELYDSKVLSSSLQAFVDFLSKSLESNLSPFQSADPTKPSYRFIVKKIPNEPQSSRLRYFIEITLLTQVLAERAALVTELNSLLRDFPNVMSLVDLQHFHNIQNLSSRPPTAAGIRYEHTTGCQTDAC